ncbi:MAG: hypothetical protein KJ893_11020 [Candidatus Omnitrophica bacterium]|nr:hypothetical protein [Candidatus Omnitrophota bacterium]MBU4479750.1 hypothetical protein [Candidatus Omnitrophota bacterium]
MKKLIAMFLTAAAVISVISPVFAEENKPAGKVIAYYFHGSFRCVTCNNMERYAREAIETNFKDALDSGEIEFKSVNVEERGNEHFVTDYQLYTKSLILSRVKDGKEIKSKNLDKIWDCVRSKQTFIDYVTREIRGFLKEAQ